MCVHELSSKPADAGPLVAGAGGGGGPSGSGRGLLPGFMPPIQPEALCRGPPHVPIQHGTREWVASGSAVNCQVEQLPLSMSQQAARHAAGVFALDAVRPVHFPAVGSKLLALQLDEE